MAILLWEDQPARRCVSEMVLLDYKILQSTYQTDKRTVIFLADEYWVVIPCRSSIICLHQPLFAWMASQLQSIHEYASSLWRHLK
jgi:hypothetical protein